MVKLFIVSLSLKHHRRHMSFHGTMIHYVVMVTNG